MDEDKILEQHNDNFQKKIEAEQNIAIEKTQNRLRQITPKILADFIEIKGASKTCLSCGDSRIGTGKSGNLAKADGDNNKVPYQDTWWATFYTRAGGNDRKITEYYYEIACINCGFVSRYRASTVVNWFEEKEREIAKRRGEE